MSLVIGLAFSNVAGFDNAFFVVSEFKNREFSSNISAIGTLFAPLLIDPAGSALWTKLLIMVSLHMDLETSWSLTLNGDEYDVAHEQNSVLLVVYVLPM